MHLEYCLIRTTAKKKLCKDSFRWKTVNSGILKWTGKYDFQTTTTIIFEIRIKNYHSSNFHKSKKVIWFFIHSIECPKCYWGFYLHLEYCLIRSTAKKNFVKVVFAEKPLIQWHFLKWTGKYDFQAKTTFIFENSSIRKKTNMLQTQQLS